jgi:hypothetical protein
VSAIRNIERHEAFIGAIVSWMHKPRGGYGYIIPVPAVIAGLNLDGDRATIQVKTKAGSTVIRHVLLSSLRWPNSPFRQ